MKGKEIRCACILPVLVCFLALTGISAFWLHAYEQASFGHVSGFCQTVLEDAPQLETQMLFSLKKYCSAGGQEKMKQGEAFLGAYGYRRSDFSLNMRQEAVLILIIALLAIACAFFVSGMYLYRYSQKRIDGLTDYLEQVNSGSSKTLLQIGEDCFSRLQDEIYKTVTALYQTREEAVREKENFADNLANIAHQLKTPVTAAFLSLQMMEQMPADDDGKEIRNYAGRVKKQLKRLNCLEEALLTLSRLDAGTLQLERSCVDVYTVLNLAAENLEELLRKKKISVNIPEGECVEFCGDLEWTMEAFMNLMKNCMEHSAQGSVICCEYSQNPLYTEILIWDEGMGFAEEDIPHLFERFYRGKGAVGNGIGIGLSLSRSIVELQNGSLTARNLPRGGACFEVRIYARDRVRG